MMSRRIRDPRFAVLCRAAARPTQHHPGIMLPMSVLMMLNYHANLDIECHHYYQHKSLYLVLVYTLQTVVYHV